MQVYLIQWFLVTKGYNPGPIDGILGAKTRAAISAFQTDRGQHSTGTITAAVVEAFNKEAAPGRWPVWLHHAIGYIGVEEIPGAANNPTIMDWAMVLKVNYSGDEIEWCGLFVAAMLRKASPEIALPDNVLGARKYLGTGREIDPSSAKIGDLVVLWRVSKSDWRGHVGFYMGMSGGSVLMLAGNQGNSVSITRHDRTRLLGIRRPEFAEEGAIYA